MDQILEGFDGFVSIANDVAVYGQNNKDHDKNQHNLMIWAAETGIVFNSEKCFFKPISTFFFNIYTPTGIKPDPAKVYNTKKMLTP